MKTVEFTQMKHGNRAEYALLHTLESDYIRALPDRLLQALSRLGDSLQGYQPSRGRRCRHRHHRGSPVARPGR